MGVFIGLGGPLISSSLESFYQEALENAEKTEEGENKSQESFLLSTKHGRFFPILSVIGTFLILYIFYKTIGAGHAFVVSIMIDCMILCFLLFELRTFDDTPSTHITTIGFKGAYKALMYHPQIRFASILELLAWLSIYIIGYYSLLTLGRLLTESSPIFWFTLIGFVFAIQVLSPYLQGILFPKYLSTMNKSNKITLCFFLSAIVSMMIYGIDLKIENISLFVILFILLAVTVDLFFSCNHVNLEQYMFRISTVSFLCNIVKCQNHTCTNCCFCL
ncbi:MAG: hypothetical protein R3A45_04160 [Bdellovibrionota bacterium]